MRALAASSDMRIIDEGRMSRRTIADAIEIFRSCPRFSPNMRVTVLTGPLPLPSGDVPFLLIVACTDVGLAVTLPTSNKFRAKRANSPRGSSFEEWETPILDGSAVERTEDQVQVALPDGQRLCGVEIIPYAMPPHGDRPREVSSFKMHMALIEHIVRMHNAEDCCYRLIDNDLLPGVRALDFSTLQTLNLRPLSEIMHHLQLNNAELNAVSRQTVANVLRDWGLRISEPRPRRGKSK